MKLMLGNLLECLLLEQHTKSRKIDQCSIFHFQTISANYPSSKVKVLWCSKEDKNISQLQIKTYIRHIITVRIVK